MNISIVSLLDNIIKINVPSKSDYIFLTNIFQSDDYGNIYRKQVASDVFKSKLCNFDTLSKKQLKLKYYLSKIPRDSYFLIIGGSVVDIDEQYRLRTEVSALNGRSKDNSKDLLIRLDLMFNLYHVQIFNGAGGPQYFGESQTCDRICRFCGKKEPEVKFSNKSHAISECLGNKSLICNEECDNCNDKFSMTIEADIAKMLTFILTLHSIPGKRGLRKTKGRNFKMSLDQHTAKDDNIGTLKIEFNSDLQINNENFIKKSIPLDLSNQKYIPQNIYKCLCKYVVSILNNDKLTYFQDTILWINSATKYRKLPMVAIGNSTNTLNHPVILISIRKNDDYRYPYCFAILSIANTAFAFIIPFSSKDKYKFTTSKASEKFHQILHTYYNTFKWSFAHLSSSKNTHTSIEFTLNSHLNLK